MPLGARQVGGGDDATTTPEVLAGAAAAHTFQVWNMDMNAGMECKLEVVMMHGNC